MDFIKGVVNAVINNQVALETILVFQLLDIVSGLLAAVKSKAVSSSKMKAGIFNKFGEILVLIVTFILKPATGVDLTVAVLTYYIFMEGVSVLENLSKAGINIPNQLAKYLQSGKSEVDQNDDSEQK